MVPNPTREVLGFLCVCFFNVAVPQITSGEKKGTSLVSATNSVLFLIYTLLQQHIHFQCELHLKDCEVHAVTVLKSHMFSLLSRTRLVSRWKNEYSPQLHQERQFPLAP